MQFFVVLYYCALSTNKKRKGENMAITPKAARVNAGLTQAQAAKAVGKSKNTIANYELYRTSPPMDIAEKLASLYGLTVNDIKWENK
jgi:DNA-binding XRE family transcriptional regulator